MITASVMKELNAIDGFLLIARAVSDRVTKLLKKFLAQNNSKKNCQGKEEDLIDLSRESDIKQEEITEKKKAFVDADKQKALNVRDIAIKT